VGIKGLITSVVYLVYHILTVGETVYGGAAW